MFMIKPNTLSLLSRQRPSYAIRTYTKQLPKLNNYFVPKRTFFYTPTRLNLKKPSTPKRKGPEIIDLTDKEFEEIYGGKPQEPLVKGFDAENARRIDQNQRPINCDPKVAYWLFFVASLVFSIIIIGGLTRLTESGLSITEWKPITGAIPPLTQADWEEEFNKYKESPEFKQLNSHMNLDDFKYIFYYEWGHRLLGRAIGVVFVIPTIYFLFKRKYTSRKVNRRLIAMAGLIGLQGFIGWWMVKSGLDEDELIDRKSKPTVSQYRLTTHLSTAFILYLGLLYTGWGILRDNAMLKNPEEAVKKIKILQDPRLYKIRNFSRFVLFFAFATAMSGGMVAGLDAGLIYNTFPKMGETWFPSSGELFNNHYLHKNDDPKSDRIWRNLLENPVTVQLVHRCMAITTFTMIMAGQWYTIRLRKQGILPRELSKAMHGVAGFAFAQVALGISTLIYIVPIELASLHQGGAILLLTWCALFNFKLGIPKYYMLRAVKKLTLTKAAKPLPKRV